MPSLKKKSNNNLSLNSLSTKKNIVCCMGKQKQCGFMWQLAAKDFLTVRFGFIFSSSKLVISKVPWV